MAHCELFLLVLLLLLVWIVLSKTKGARLTLRNEKDQETLMQHEQSRLVKIRTTKPINLRFCPLGYVFHTEETQCRHGLDTVLSSYSEYLLSARKDASAPPEGWVLRLNPFEVHTNTVFTVAPA